MKGRYFYKTLKYMAILLLIGIFISPTFMSVEQNSINNNSNSNNGLIAHWTFNDIENEEVAEDIISGFNGRVENAEWKTDGISGSCLEFSEEEDIVTNIPNAFDDGISNQFTICCWVYWYGIIPDSYEGGGMIFDARQVGVGGFKLQIKQEGKVIFFIRDGNEGNKEVLSETTVKPNEWTHITAVFDYMSNEIKVFINGLYDNSNQIDFSYLKSEISPAIGNNHWAPGDLKWTPFYGKIDEVQLYNRALSEAEILQLAYLPSIHIDHPKNQQRIQGEVSVFGSTNSPLDSIQKIMIKIGTGKWEKTHGSPDGWSYWFNSTAYETGPLTISARAFVNDEFFTEDQIIVYVDNDDKIPQVNITSPHSIQCVNGIVDIKGEFSDYDGYVEKVLINIQKTGWKETLMNESNWLYQWDTTVETSTSFNVEVKCVDNENYSSPISSISLFVDNEIPEVNFIRPQNNYWYIFFEKTRIDWYFPPISFVLGKLEAIIEVTENSDFVEKVFLYLNNDEEAYGMYPRDYPQEFVYTNMQWNHACYGDECSIKVKAINQNGNYDTDEIQFRYWNFN